MRTNLVTHPSRLATAKSRWLVFACILCGLIGGCTEPKPEPKKTAESPSPEQAKPKPAAPERAASKPAEEAPKPVEPAPAMQPPEEKPVQVAALPPAEHAKPAIVAPTGVGLGMVNPLDLILPPVLLTAQHAKTCLLKVGDQFPELTLPKLSGGAQPLKELFGERATLIVFWKAGNPYAIEELAHIQRSIIEQFEPQGVRVITIDVQDPPDVVQEVVERLQLNCPVLLDADGKAYAQLATGMFPRTYVVDESGKIVWFDIEYSLSTRRELNRALLTTLHKGH